MDPSPEILVVHKIDAVSGRCVVFVHEFGNFYLIIYLQGLMHPRWLALGFLNHQQYDSRTFTLYELPQNPPNGSLEAVISDLAQPVERADPEAIETKNGHGHIGQQGVPSFLNLAPEVGIQEEFLSQPCYRHNFLNSKQNCFVLGLFLPICKQI